MRWLERALSVRMADRDHVADISHPLERNLVWNLIGQVLPLSVAVLAIPVLVRGLGVADYGLLVLAWAFIGYSSIFDLGLGRALTQLIARNFGHLSSEEEEAELVWISLALMAALGTAGAVLVVIAAPYITD